MTAHDAVLLCAELVQRNSQTPDDAGCQKLLAARLEPLGFNVEWMPSGPVQNVWIRHGTEPPLFAFAGHTDVVPTGPVDTWKSPPFSGAIHGGALHGRGAADMKSGVAAMTVAAERFIRDNPNHRGSLALLLTSDEEGAATEGTAHVIRTLQARDEHIDWCVVGEPSSEHEVGDTLRIGRRGSLGGKLTVRGVQGHVAYPHLTDNPVHRLAPALAELASETWDQGSQRFPPTTFQVSNIHGGTGAANVIPGNVTVDFNFRFGTASGVDVLRSRVEAILDAHALHYSIDWHCNAEPFLTEGDTLIGAIETSIAEIAGIKPQRSTAGGTSDGRFIAPTGAEVVEFGVRNATVHQIDERIDCADIIAVADIYEQLLGRLLGARQ